MRRRRAADSSARSRSFIRSWFKTFYDRSVTTQEFKQHLSDYYASNEEISKKIKAIDWDAWLHNESGKLPVKMEYDDTLAVQAFALAERWEKVKGNDTAGFGKKDIEVSTCAREPVRAVADALAALGLDERPEGW